MSAAFALESFREGPVVETTYGKLKGLVDRDVKVFRGIRYGADTSGLNRFLPPKAPASWSGVARRSSSARSRRNSIRTSRAPKNPFYPIDPANLPENEDCLRLNVYSEKPRLKAPSSPSWCTTMAAASRRARQHPDVSRRKPGAERRRGGGHHQSPPQCVRLHLSRQAARARIHDLGQCRHDGRRRGARMGARQYRGFRRRSEQRHDFRQIRRRLESLHADGHAGRQEVVPSRHHPVRARHPHGRRRGRSRRPPRCC